MKKDITTGLESKLLIGFDPLYKKDNRKRNI